MFGDMGNSFHLRFRRLTEIDVAADEGFADGAQTPLPFDFAVTAHAPLRPRFGINDFRRFLPEPPAAAIKRGRRLHLQRLMRPFLVVLPLPAPPAASSEAVGWLRL